MPDHTVTPPKGSGRRQAAGIDIHGADVRAQSRQLATVVTVTGAVDAANVDPISEYARRFLLAGKALVLDLTGVTDCDEHVASLLCAVDDDSRSARIEWAVVMSDAVASAVNYPGGQVFPAVETLAASFQYFLAASLARQRLLPLLGKSA